MRMGVDETRRDCRVAKIDLCAALSGGLYSDNLVVVNDNNALGQRHAGDGKNPAGR
jgi:hypothetical protein